MSINKLFDRSKQLVTFICQGELSFNEVSSHLKRMYTSDDIEYIRDVIWDLRNATLAGFSNEEILRIRDIVKGGKKVRKPGKSALVFPEDVDFGLGRMYEAQTQDLHIETRVFRTMEEALHWLEKDTDT